MNSGYQTFLALSIVLLAVGYLVWMVKRSRKNRCGSHCSCAHAKLPAKQIPQEKRCG